MSFVDNLLKFKSIILNSASLRSAGGSTGLGERLRRLAATATLRNGWARAYMKSVKPWQPSTVYKLGEMVVNGGSLYVCNQGGTSTATVPGGPTHVNVDAVQDNGTLYWLYFGPNIITSDPYVTLTTWAASTAYTLGQQVINNGLVYACVTAGTSASSGGPTATTNGITDNTAKWTYMGVYKASPYPHSTPALTSSTTVPTSDSLTNAFRLASSGKFSLEGYQVLITRGSGYAVNEVITLTGGTFTTAAQITVNTVDGSGGITSCTVTRAGVYSVLPGYPVAQGSSSGAGTGATFMTRFKAPSWCKIRGGFLAEYATTESGRIYTFQPAALAKPIYQHMAIEFWSDAPIIAFGSVFAGTKQITIDGVRYSIDNLSTVDATYYKFDFTKAGGRKPRFYRIETNLDRAFTGAYVDTSSQVWAPDEPDYTRAVMISDSIAQGSLYGPCVVGGSLTNRLSLDLGLDIFNMSISGTGYINRGSAAGTTTDAYSTRVAEALGLNPSVIFLFGSTNDATNTAAAVTAAHVALVAALRAGGFTGPIIVLGLWPANVTNGATTETAVQSGIASDPIGKSYFIPLYNADYLPWITGSWNNNPAPSGITQTASTNASTYVSSGDSLHPVDLGTAYLASRIATEVKTKIYPLL